jgi:hypothetical protein
LFLSTRERFGSWKAIQPRSYGSVKRKRMIFYSLIKCRCEACAECGRTPCNEISA